MSSVRCTLGLVYLSRTKLKLNCRSMCSCPCLQRLPAIAGVTAGCLLPSSSESCSSSGDDDDDHDEDDDDGSVTMSAAASVVVNAGPTPNCSGGGPAHATLAATVLANAQVAVAAQPSWGDVRDRRQAPGLTGGGVPGSSSLSVSIGAPTFAPSTLRRNTSPRHQQHQQQYLGNPLSGAQLLGPGASGHASGANSRQLSKPVEFEVVAEERNEDIPWSL